MSKHQSINPSEPPPSVQSEHPSFHHSTYNLDDVPSFQPPLPAGVYTFSFYRHSSVPRIKRRPWWNLFGRDTMDFHSMTTHCSFRVSRDEAEVLRTASRMNWKTPLGNVIKLLAGGEAVHGVQLELGNPATTYFKHIGDGNFIKTAPPNLVPNITTPDVPHDPFDGGKDWNGGKKGIVSGSERGVGKDIRWHTTDPHN